MNAIDFGRSFVTFVTPERGNNARIQINFDAVGGKWLVAAYARLEAL